MGGDAPNIILYKQRTIGREKIEDWIYCEGVNSAETPSQLGLFRSSSENRDSPPGLETLDRSRLYYDHRSDSYLQELPFTDDEMAKFAQNYLKNFTQKNQGGKK